MTIMNHFNIVVINYHFGPTPKKVVAKLSFCGKLLQASQFAYRFKRLNSNKISADTRKPFGSET